MSGLASDLSDEDFNHAMENSLYSATDENDAIDEDLSGEPHNETPSNVDEEEETPETDDVDSTEAVEEDEEGNESDEEESTSEEEEDSTEEETDAETTADDIPEEYTTALKESEEYKKILAPFKANGKMMSVKNSDEAVTLMKMGANYVKKMTVLKPRLNVVKTLEENELLDENKLNQLIDIQKGDKKALAAFLKSQDIDPVSLLDEDTENYKPNEYKVDETREAIVETLESIQSDAPEQYGTLVKDVINGWDDRSKERFSDKPELLNALVGNMQVKLPNGNTVFDEVSTELTRQKTLGNYKGQSDLEAYFAIGQAMFENQAKENSLDVPKKQLPPKSKKANVSQDTEIRRKKVAVNRGSTSKTSRTTKNATSLDKLNDEDFSTYMDNLLAGN